MTRSHSDASLIHGPNFETLIYNKFLALDDFDLVRRADKKEQKFEHWDVLARRSVDGRVRILKIDAKSIKENRDGWFLVEGRTVCTKEGLTYPGWLFSEKMTHIAQERLDGILWIPLPTLQKYVVSKNIDWSIIPNGTKTPGLVYTRVGGGMNPRTGKPYPTISDRVLIGQQVVNVGTRGDRVVRFPMNDIENLPNVWMEKNPGDRG